MIPTQEGPVMMKKIVSFISCCLVLNLMHHPQAFASHTPCPPNAPTAPVVTVLIGTETRTATDQVVLNDAGGAAHTYPNGLTIAPLAGGNAVVRVECDTTGDRLSLMNARITVSAPVTDKVIQYWATFDKLPLPAGHPTATPQTTPATPDVWYKLVGAGSGVIASSNTKLANGDKIVAKGEILNPVPGTWKIIGTRTKTVLSTDPNPVPFFSNSSSWKYPRPPELTGERHIRGTVTVTLNNTADRVELGNGIVIHNSTTACPDCGPDDDNPPSGWCMTTNSTAQALGCPSCLTEDGMVAQDKKVAMFAKSAWSNLSEDIARGQGEYLTSLAILLDVSGEQRASFFAWMQNQYATRVQLGAQAPEQLVRDLATKWKAAQIRPS
jgi:hypothetical protein